MPDDSRFEQLDQAIDAMLAGAAPPAEEPELHALVDVCDRLRHLPDEDFRNRLKSELQRRATMSPAMHAYRRPGFRTVTPCLIVPGAEQLVDFVKTTFDAEEVSRQTVSGEFYAELRLGSSMLMIVGGGAVEHGIRTAALHVYVPDCDAVYRRAIEAGATSMGEPADRPYGERSGFVKDAAGNNWYIATLPGERYAPETGDLMPYLHPASAPKYIEFLERAFGAQELSRFGNAGRVMHATVRVGDSVIEMGEPDTGWPHLPTALHLYVEDVDAVYATALAAGATSFRPPADQPNGEDRSAVIQDPFGFVWFPATHRGSRTR